MPGADRHAKGTRPAEGIANIAVGALMVLIVLAGIWVAVETQRGAHAPGPGDSLPQPTTGNPLP
ncbi:hypothetical protein BAY61_09680 [Prauserella marina]|uniref:Uncharacterized protein n=1 Tax=Prauserella marina TaxID=530584 RepID=A0A222VN71_9PSEU|nr:hypothetical protein BAY61_09680 [Prauserella marina]PWV85019.1 hypothetical protein DES30_1011039 [Prauserella marina]SDC06700.1 hypothetical protein SAMN05421630_101297 [Prauserella marina]